MVVDVLNHLPGMMGEVRDISQATCGHISPSPELSTVSRPLLTKFENNSESLSISEGKEEGKPGLCPQDLYVRNEVAHYCAFQQNNYCQASSSAGRGQVFSGHDLRFPFWRPWVSVSEG